MVRLTAIFVTLCMVLIAGSLGTILYISFGFTKLEAAVAAIAALTGLALFNAVATRGRDYADVGGKIVDLSRGTADLARQVAEIGRRVVAVENEVSGAGERARSAIAPMSAEIEVLGNLVKQLADSVSAHETALVELSERSAFKAAQLAPRRAAPGQEAMGDSPTVIDRAELGDPEPEPGEKGQLAGKSRDEIVELIRDALDGNRIDLYLQPIVTLPQRKVRYYEAMTWLRTEDGRQLLPGDYLAHAESGGLMPTIDNMLLFRCVQVVRRLLAKNREIGLFCNISGASLVDPAFFTDFSEFMQANRALAASLVFEFGQPTVRGMGPIEHESLAALAELGFRFSMDHVDDLRIEPREFAERGFRFVKVPASLLLSRASMASDIHPADFSDLLGRFGIDLIVEGIESEASVVDLLDFDVRFGQGVLFSPPRPVRAEVLQGIPERAGDARREAEPEPARPAGQGAGAVREPEPPAPEPVSIGRRSSAIAQLARGVVRRA